MITSPCIWTIGGTDPTGSAGVFRDIRTIDFFGLHPVAIVSTVTSQNLSKVAYCESLDTKLILSQIELMTKEFPPSAIKVSLPGITSGIDEVFKALSSQNCPIIWDPVLSSGTGYQLMPPDTMHQVMDRFASDISLVTPNLYEASALTGHKVVTKKDMIHAANILTDRGFSNVLIKGGHIEGHVKTDLLASKSRLIWLEQSSLPNHVHGTGCLYSTGIVCFLQKYDSLVDAVILANALVHQGIRSSISVNENIDQKMMPIRFNLEELALPAVRDPRLPEGLSFSVLPARCKGLYPIAHRAKDLELAWKMGARYGQIRIKDLQGEALVSELRQAIKTALKYQACLFVNDYWELALELGAEGIHLGSEDILAADLHKIKDAGVYLGVSTHSVEEAAIASSINPGYISFGPIFETSCKKMKFTPRGIEMIKNWKAYFNRHVVAIGGLKSPMKSLLAGNGADGFGVISDIYSSGSPGSQLKKWLN